MSRTTTEVLGNGRIMHINNSKEEIDELILKNTRLIYHIIKTRWPTDFDNPDTRDQLYSVGVEGLIKAARYFDKTKGIKFATYASRMIEGYIQRYKREKIELIRPPRDISNIRANYNKLEKLGKTEEQICYELGVTKEQLYEAINFGVNYLDGYIAKDREGNELTLYDLVSIDDQVEDSVITKYEQVEKLELYKKILNKKQYDILILALKGINQHQIGIKLNLSQSYISRVLTYITEAVAPNINRYYDGEISYNQMMAYIKKEGRPGAMKKNVKEKMKKYIDAVVEWAINHPGEPVESVTAIVREKGMKPPSSSHLSKIKGWAEDAVYDAGYKTVVIEKSRGYDWILINKELENMKVEEKYRTEINIVKGWALDNPFNRVNVKTILKSYDMKIPCTHSLLRIKEVAKDELIKAGYNIEVIQKPRGYDWMVVVPSMKNNSEVTVKNINDFGDKYKDNKKGDDSKMNNSKEIIQENKTQLLQLNNIPLDEVTIQSSITILEGLYKLIEGKSKKATVTIIVNQLD